MGFSANTCFCRITISFTSRMSKMPPDEQICLITKKSRKECKLKNESHTSSASMMLHIPSSGETATAYAIRQLGARTQLELTVETWQAAGLIDVTASANHNLE